MGVFGSIVPVITVGAISKRWVVPGWRLGWLVTNDHNGILIKSGVCSLSSFVPSASQKVTVCLIDEISLSNVYLCLHLFQVIDSIKGYLNITSEPVTFIQVVV